MKPTAILIVEDEFILARDLELRLRDLGYIVTGIAATGADALALADRQHPDLVLMDIYLQGPMDGIDAAQEIHRRWRLPVVFLTAYADDDTLQRAKLVEPFGYILKPFEDRELRTLIEIALYKHQAEEEIRRLSDLYAALSQINQAIVRIGARQELFDEVCRVTAGYGGFLLAWIGWIDPQTQHVRPVARAGVAAGYLDGIVVYADDLPEGRDPMSVCLSEGRPCIFNDLLDDPRVALRHEAAHQHGLRAAAALPIRLRGAVCAVFVVYAATPEIFQTQEINLLEEAAADISFALDHLETERQRQDAEEKLRESEARVRAKLDSLLSPEGDIGTLDLADILDVSAIQATMDEFFKLTGIGVGIVDLRGRVLVGTGKQEVCAKFHQVHPVTRQSCIESDTVLSRGVEPGTFKIYRCKNQMYDIATPIMVGERHLGNLFMGQFFFDDEPPDREFFRDQARRHGFDEQEYLAAVARTPCWSRDRVNTAMAFYTRLAHLFSTLSYSNIKLVRSMTERDALLDSLKASEARLRESSAFLSALLNAIPMPVFYKDLAGRYLGFNQAFEKFYGQPRQELIGKSVFDLAPAELAEMYRAKDLELLRQSGSQVYDSQVRDNRGEVRDVIFHKATFTDDASQVRGIIGAIVDVTDRKRMEDKTDALHHFLRAVLDALPAHIAILDDRGTILDVNAAWKRFADNNALADANYCVGQNYLAICDAATDTLRMEDKEVAAGIRAVINRTIDSFSLEYSCHPPGETGWFMLRATPFAGSGPACVVVAHTDISDRKLAEERITHLAYYDTLTQLPNRVLLTDRLQQAIAQTQRDQKRLAVCYLDLDGFKPINDTWGHDQGDQILVEVAQRLKYCVRAGDTVARLGGDEFILLLTDLAEVEECERALDRVLTALYVPFHVAGQPVSLTASLGVTLYPDDESDPDTLLRHSDQAMYAAKQAGGHRYRWFDADYDRRARAHRELLQRVEAGVVAGEFRLHYQPKVDMRTGAVIGVEALIRWQYPDEGLLLPARFIPAVETSELAIVVDCWVIQEALRQMTVWAAQGLNLPVSINISGRYLQQSDFVARLQAVLALYPTVPPDRLELEILETAALDDVAAISRLIKACQQLGIRFALDDFGTGYSSLTYLKYLPVQVLKIDQSFVRNLLVDADAQAIVEGVIGLSAAFRREVIAEGVETDAHGCRLIQLGCLLAQGYGIARPMPPEQIPAWIAGWTLPSAWTDEADFP